jgi:hypothetical protein
LASKRLRPMTGLVQKCPPSIHQSVQAATWAPCLLWAYSVEKLENPVVLFFRYRGKISKTAAKIAPSDSQKHQVGDDRKLAAPSAKISKRLPMKRIFLDRRQMGSFSTE